MNIKYIITFLTLLYASTFSVHAATFNFTPVADIFFTEVSSSQGKVIISDVSTKYLRATKDNQHNESSTAFLKFDILSPNNLNNDVIDFTSQRIKSAQLKLTSSVAFNAQDPKSNNSLLTFYFVSDDSWREGPINTVGSKPMPEINLTNVIGNGNLDYIPREKKVIIDLESNYLNAQINEIKSNNLVSLAIFNTSVGHNPSTYYSYVEFFSKEYNNGQYTPMLTLETESFPYSVPTPEPSSIFLGLMSLCAMLGLKKRKVV